MTLSLCIISFTFGLLAIDAFCDHYIFLSPSLTNKQIDTCSSYYQNAAEQPWFMSLVTAVPIAVGLIMMLKNFNRSVYDIISVPIFFSVIGIFILRVKPNVEALLSSSSLGKDMKTNHLRQIANNHGIMALLLIVLTVMQLLAENQRQKNASKKKA